VARSRITAKPRTDEREYLFIESLLNVGDTARCVLRDRDASDAVRK